MAEFLEGRGEPLLNDLPAVSLRGHKGLAHLGVPQGTLVALASDLGLPLMWG